MSTFIENWTDLDNLAFELQFRMMLWFGVWLEDPYAWLYAILAALAIAAGGLTWCALRAITRFRSKRG